MSSSAKKPPVGFGDATNGVNGGREIIASGEISPWIWISSAFSSSDSFSSVEMRGRTGGAAWVRSRSWRARSEKLTDARRTWAWDAGCTVPAGSSFTRSAAVANGTETKAITAIEGSAERRILKPAMASPDKVGGAEARGKGRDTGADAHQV